MQGQGFDGHNYSDISKFATALVRGDGLSAASRVEMTRRIAYHHRSSVPHVRSGTSSEQAGARICMPVGSRELVALGRAKASGKKILFIDSLIVEFFGL